MSNKSKRKRTDFTGSQNWNRQDKRINLFGQRLNEIWDKKLTEAFSSSLTASTGAEDMKRQGN